MKNSFSHCLLLVSALLAAGADVDATGIDDGRTALVEAAARLHPAVTEALLAHPRIHRCVLSALQVIGVDAAAGLEDEDPEEDDLAALTRARAHGRGARRDEPERPRHVERRQLRVVRVLARALHEQRRRVVLPGVRGRAHDLIPRLGVGPVAAQGVGVVGGRKSAQQVGWWRRRRRWWRRR
jgi:hypothetical protein